MWLFTSSGFISVVRHRQEPDILIVRARQSEHLTEQFPDQVDRVYRQSEADYPYRLHLRELEFTEWLREYVVNDLKYDNFKSSVEDSLLESACFQVWSVLDHTYKHLRP